MTCESIECARPGECLVLPWEPECEGYWDCQSGTCAEQCALPFCPEEIPFHAPVLDEEGLLLPWTSYDEVVRTAMEFIATCPTDEVTGLPWYMQYSNFRHENMSPSPWPHNPAGLDGMMVETLLRYWPYTGDRRWIELVRVPLDHLIDESTPDSYLWPHVPYASADNTGRYRGASHDGRDGIEPDKVAQAAVGYLRFFQITGEERYLEEALHCADVLARTIRPGDEDHSPWPFRVNARTGEVIEEYTSDALWPVVLFDELERMGRSTPARRSAREAAWGWLMTYPMENMRWKGYFEDVPVDEQNENREQYVPGEVARYLLLRPELDEDWRAHVPALLSWIRETLGDQDERFYGATGIREQLDWLQLSGSHTARFASLCALWHEASGDDAFREEALRSFALAAYLARGDGVVIFSICDTSVWFTDGYFDYVPHFIDGMAALPEMAPEGEDHLLASTSVVTEISYEDDGVEYTTFHAEGREVLRLSFTPTAVLADGAPLEELEASDQGPGYRVDRDLGVVRVRRAGARRVEISAR
jgi:hypothetical protein